MLIVQQYIDLLKQNPSTRHNPMLADYVLCGHLLRNDMHGFMRDIRKYYDLSTPGKVIELPKAYREALLLQAKAIGRDSLSAFADTSMLAAYRDYTEIKSSEEKEIVRNNRLRRNYGNTFWWYVEQE